MKDAMFYLVDIDGTIADLSHRLHFIDGTNGPANWDAFFEACDKDAPIKQVIDTINELSRTLCRLIFITGRSEGNF